MPINVTDSILYLPPYARENKLFGHCWDHTRATSVASNRIIHYSMPLRQSTTNKIVHSYMTEIDSQEANLIHFQNRQCGAAQICSSHSPIRTAAWQVTLGTMMQPSASAKRSSATQPAWPAQLPSLWQCLHWWHGFALVKRPLAAWHVQVTNKWDKHITMPY